MTGSELGNFSNHSNDVLVTEQLTKRYSNLLAVNDVSFKVRSGSCLTILGPNGAGKTTIVEMLEGLKVPDSGSIKIFGKEFNKTSKHLVLENIGVLLQETQLYKKLTVLETLQLFASFYEQPADPLTILKKMRLENKSDTRLEHLSGGLRQRVYLGCALINNPKLLFLDEPTTGLDPQARRDIWTIINELKADGCAILLTTHYMEEAEILADDVLVINSGKIIFHGPTKQLLKSYDNKSTAHIVFRAEDDVVQKLAELGFSNLIAHGYGEYEMTAPGSDISKIVQQLSKFELHIQEIKVQHPRLEDIYLILTGSEARA